MGEGKDEVERRGEEDKVREKRRGKEEREGLASRYQRSTGYRVYHTLLNRFSAQLWNRGSELLNTNSTLLGSFLHMWVSMLKAYRSLLNRTSCMDEQIRVPALARTNVGTIPATLTLAENPP